MMYEHARLGPKPAMAYQNCITRFTGDVGVEIGTLAWSSDGQALAFERGGEPNPRDFPRIHARSTLNDRAWRRG